MILSDVLNGFYFVKYYFRFRNNFCFCDCCYYFLNVYNTYIYLNAFTLLTGYITKSTDLVIY